MATTAGFSPLEGLGFTDIQLDPRLNANPRPDADIAAPNSPTRVRVIHTEEERIVALEVRRVIGGNPELTNS